MDNSTLFLLAVVALLGLMFVFLFATARRRDADRAVDTAPATNAPADESTANLPVLAAHASPSGRYIYLSVAL